MSVEFPADAPIGTLVDGDGFTWIKEENNHWSKILNSTKFTQSIISIVRDPAVPAFISNAIVSINRLTAAQASPMIGNDQLAIDYV